MLFYNKMNIFRPCFLCIHHLRINEISYCKKFEYLVIPLHFKYKKIPYYIDSVTCRKNEELCGKKGVYFENDLNK